MTAKAERQAVGLTILAQFRDAGAVEVAPDILLPSDTLLDLYGEDIRARAYVTSDPVRGEMMLRPDFTVPVVQMHMENGAEPARYCYLGEIFRKQDHSDTRPEHPRDSEYLQVGYELFARDDAADAEIFALFHQVLAPLQLRAVTGDMALLMAAIGGLPISAARRSALLHHIWRRGRFEQLLGRFSAPTEPRSFAATDAPWIGLRSEDEMQIRIARLEADRDAPPLPGEWVERLHRLFALTGPLPEALRDLRTLASEMPAITDGVARFAARISALEARGIDPAQIHFNASHGRQTMEYYDGFTFTFVADRADWPPVASGGRYDALTSVLGAGRAIPAVGGIIRPGLVAELGGL